MTSNQPVLARRRPLSSNTDNNNTVSFLEDTSSYVRTAPPPLFSTSSSAKRGSTFLQHIENYDAGDLIPETTQDFLHEIENNHNDNNNNELLAQDELFSKLVNQFANTIRFDESVSGLSASHNNNFLESSANFAGHSDHNETRRFSGIPGIQVSAASGNVGSSKGRTSSDASSPNTNHHLLDSNANSNKLFLRKSAAQTKNILQETTRKMKEGRENRGKSTSYVDQNSDAIDFPKKLKQIFRKLIWPALKKKFTTADDDVDNFFRDDVEGKNIFGEHSKKTNKNDDDEISLRSRSSSSSSLQRKHSKRTDSEQGRGDDDDDDFYSDDPYNANSHRKNIAGTGKLHPPSSWNPLLEFTKEEIRSLWIDFSRVFASEITEGKFNENDDDDDADGEGGGALDSDDDEGGSSCLNLTNNSSHHLHRSSPLSPSGVHGKGGGGTGTPRNHNLDDDDDEEEETFEQHLLKKQQRLLNEKEKKLEREKKRASGVLPCFEQIEIKKEDPAVAAPKPNAKAPPRVSSANNKKMPLSAPVQKPSTAGKYYQKTTQIYPDKSSPISASPSSPSPKSIDISNNNNSNYQKIRSEKERRRQEMISRKKHERIEETLDIITQLQNWSEIAISKRTLAEFSLLNGIEIDGAHQNIESALQQNQQQQDLWNSAQQQTLSSAAGSSNFDPGTDEMSLSPNNHFQQQNRPPAYLLQKRSASETQNFVPGTGAGSTTASPSPQRSRDHSNFTSVLARKKKLTFLDVLKWLCVDSELALHDKHAKLKVRMRASGCRPLSSKTIDSLFQVFSVFDGDASGELDRAEIGKLFTLMTTSAATATNTRQGDSPMSPVALARKARSHSIVSNNNHENEGSASIASSSPNNNNNQIHDSPFENRSPTGQQQNNSTNSRYQDPSQSISFNRNNSNANCFQNHQSNRLGSDDDASVLSGSLLSPVQRPQNHSFEGGAFLLVNNNINNNGRSELPFVLPLISGHDQKSEMNDVDSNNILMSGGLNEEDLDLLMDVIDEDGNGKINFQEALLLLASDLDGSFFEKRKFTKKYLAETVKMGNGFSFGGVESSSSSSDSSSTPSSSDDSTDEDSDDDNSNNNNTKLFLGTGKNIRRNSVKSMTKHNKNKNSSSSSAASLRGLRESGLDQKIMHCFRKHDPYRTGYISMAHLRIAVLELAGEHLTLEHIEDIITAADGIRGDGYVHYLSWDALWQCARGESSLKE